MNRCLSALSTPSCQVRMLAAALALSEAAEKRAGATTERNFRFSSESAPNPNASTRSN